MKICTVLFLSLIYYSLSAQQLLINIQGIRSSKGVIRIGVFENQQQFDEEEPFRSILLAKKDVVAGNLSAEISIAPGKYAITILDDEDNSGNMTYKFKVFPIEGVGFSNYLLNKPLKPKFSDFDFDFNHIRKDIIVRIHYF